MEVTDLKSCPFCGAVPEQSAPHADVYVLSHRGNCFVRLVQDNPGNVTLFDKDSELGRAWERRDER